jgi:hypothetical protein
MSIILRTGLPMSDSESTSGFVLFLAEEFLDRYRKGERPRLREYIDRHPDLEAAIREVFPAMARSGGATPGTRSRVPCWP